MDWEPEVTVNRQQSCQEKFFRVVGLTSTAKAAPGSETVTASAKSATPLKTDFSSLLEELEDEGTALPGVPLDWETG